MQGLLNEGEGVLRSFQYNSNIQKGQIWHLIV